VVKISPEWVTGPEQGTSSGMIATFCLWTGMFGDGFPPFLMKQLYRCDSLLWYKCLVNCIPVKRNIFCCYYI